MRHPLLRILVALLMGVVTPLCCCQAAAVAGGGCTRTQASAPEADTCGGGCSGETACDRGSGESGDEPDSDRHPVPGSCSSCPSCQGTSGGTGSTGGSAESRLPVFKQDWNGLETFSLELSWVTGAPESALVPRAPGWVQSPPYLKANRDAQRWYCALIV